MKRLTAYFLMSFLLWSTPTMAENSQQAIFAGGCFWCMQPAFDKLDGVTETVVGYIGGTQPDPTYELVSSGSTDHAEAIAVYYDADKVNYQQLLDIFWRNIDPTVVNRQFCDVGKQYRTAVFYTTPEQQQLAEASKEKLIASENFPQVATEIVAAGKFYTAEDYHQDYYKKNPIRYKYYRYSCGRDKRLNELWKK